MLHFKLKAETFWLAETKWFNVNLIKKKLHETLLLKSDKLIYCYEIRSYKNIILTKVLLCRIVKGQIEQEISF